MSKMEVTTENLKVGMILKNYKELCEVIGVKPKSGGKNIKEHKEDLKRYFLFKNIEGSNRIKITKIFTEVKEKEDNRRLGNNSKYTEGRKIILSKLLQEKKEYRIISKTNLWNELGFINQNYVNRPKELAKWEEQTSIDKEMLIYFDDKTYDTCKKNCERILNGLYAERLIVWENIIKVAVLEGENVKYNYDEVGNIIGIKFISDDEKKDEIIKKELVYKIANDEINTFIIKKEKEFMKNHECKKIKDVVIKGLWREFKRYVNGKLFDEYNIKFYYRAYKILFNREFILDEVADFEKEVYEEFKSINQISLFTENAIRNNNNLAYKQSRDRSVQKAVESAKKNPKGNNDIRLKKGFKGTQITLNDMYIKLNEKDK